MKNKVYIHSLTIIAIVMFSVSSADTREIGITGPKLVKIGQNTYKATEERSTLSWQATPGTVVIWVQGFRLFPFSIDKPWAFYFAKSYNEFYRSKYYLEYGQQVKVLNIVAVVAEVKIQGKVVPKAYHCGIVENGTVIGANKVDTSEWEWGYVFGFQNVKFNIPEEIGAVSVGNITFSLGLPFISDLFVSKGEITGGKLRIDSGFKIHQLPNKEVRIETIKGRTFNLSSPRAKN